MGEEELRLLLGKYISRLEVQYPLRDLSPLRLGGVADFLTQASTVVEVASAVSAALAAKLPYLVVGGASRLVFADGGFPGLLIVNKAQSIALATERSQVVVDSGTKLSGLVTKLAGLELGGLTPFFGCNDTVGGAIYSNLSAEGHSFTSSVRSITLLLPPTTLSGEAKIVRKPAGWLQPESRPLRRTGELALWAPIILSATLQLTHNRGGELVERIRQRSQRLRSIPSKGIGPLFEIPPSGNLDSMLRVSGQNLRCGSCTIQRGAPNFADFHRHPPKARDLRDVIETLQKRVSEQFNIDLQSRYEWVGVW